MLILPKTLLPTSEEHQGTSYRLALKHKKNTMLIKRSIQPDPAFGDIFLEIRDALSRTKVALLLDSGQGWKLTAACFGKVYASLPQPDRSSSRVPPRVRNRKVFVHAPYCNLDN